MEAATKKAKKPRVTLIARADNTGLGAQTWEFYRHLKPHKTYVIDLTQINRTIGKKTELHLDRFADAMTIEGFPDNTMCLRMLEDTDVLFTVETPYNYSLFKEARKLGVKTILQINYEFLDYLQIPHLPYPDLLLAPSKWHIEDIEKLPGRSVFIPVPTNREVLPFKQRTQANHFLHVAGHPTFMDRNGTIAVLQAFQRVKSPDVKLTIYSQYAIDVLEDPRITVKHVDVENYWEIYKEEFDVLLLPRRYGGLSLQLNEALSVGMPVIMTNVEPQSRFLNPHMLIPTTGYDVIQTRTSIECHKPDIDALAAKIDDLHNSPALVTEISQWANVFSNSRSWKRLKLEYQQTIESLCQVTR